MDGSAPRTPQAAPAPSATEARLAEIWRSALNVGPIGPADDFFALGGDSLAAITVLFEVETAFGKTLPLSALLEAPTLSAFARLVDPGAERAAEPTAAASPAAAEAAPHPKEAWSPLVALRTTGARTPLFFVHGGGGQVLNFRRLSDQLGSDFPFYGLKTLYDEPGRPRRLLSIEAMAARFLAAIRRVQPQGPYAIGGYSFGGVVAYEIAQSLAREGEAVALLALIDGDVAPRGRLAEFGDYAWRVWQQKRARAQSAGKASPRRAGLETLAALGARAWEKARHLAFYRHYPAAYRHGLALPGFAFSALRAHQFAERLYEPAAPLTPIVFYRVGAAEPGMPPPPALGWQAFAPAELLEIIDVAGDHYNAMGAPSIDAIAADLAARIPLAAKAAKTPPIPDTDRDRDLRMETGAASLPWLPPPPADWRERLEAAADAATFAALAHYRLNQAQIQQLGRAFAGFRTAGGPVEGLSPVRLGLLSNATLAFLAPAVIGSGLRHGLSVEIHEAPFGQTAQQAFDPASAINQARCDLVFLALDHRGVAAKPSLEAAAQEAAITAAFEHTQALAEALQHFGGATAILASVPPPPEPLFGHRDGISPGAARAFWRGYNDRLARWAWESGHLVFDAEALAAQVGGETWHDPRAWFAAKLSFAQNLLPLVGDHLARLLAAHRGKARRVLVLDLDNTLWGGVIGDDGMGGIVLGQGDERGEAHLAVQQAALDLRARGVLLAVASKNEDAIARAVFREHPEMLLREEHITVFQANWTDKAANLQAIAQALGLGLDALVFLDDNPAERARIRQALPMVAVPELPENPAFYARTLLSAGYFEAIAFSEEDRRRATLYAAEAERAALAADSGDLDGFLASLDMTLEVAPFDALGRARITQLINKTNQFNLTTTRMSEAQVAAAEACPRHFTLQGRLRDRFGDNGMITVVIAAAEGRLWRIETWLMSCRVLGRRVEEAVLGEVVAAAREAGAEALLGRYVPTPRNGLVREHYAKLGFTCIETAADGSSLWRLEIAAWQAPTLPLKLMRHTN